jgi:hypothetical protein
MNLAEYYKLKGEIEEIQEKLLFKLKNQSRYFNFFNISTSLFYFQPIGEVNKSRF